MTLPAELRALSEHCPAVMHPDKWSPIRDAMRRAADALEVAERRMMDTVAREIQHAEAERAEAAHEAAMREEYGSEGGTR